MHIHCRNMQTFLLSGGKATFTLLMVSRNEHIGLFDRFRSSTGRNVGSCIHTEARYIWCVPVVDLKAVYKNPISFHFGEVGKCNACKYMYKVAVTLNMYLFYTLCLYAFKSFSVCLVFFSLFFTMPFYYKTFGHNHTEAWRWRDQHVKLQMDKEVGLSCCIALPLKSSHESWRSPAVCHLQCYEAL